MVECFFFLVNNRSWVFYIDNFGTEVTKQRRDIPQNTRYTFVAKILRSKVPVKTFIFSKVGT